MIECLHVCFTVFFYFFLFCRRRWSYRGAPGEWNRHPMWSALAKLELHAQ